jgi:hypothetical protein
MAINEGKVRALEKVLSKGEGIGYEIESVQRYIEQDKPYAKDGPHIVITLSQLSRGVLEGFSSHLCQALNAVNPKSSYSSQLEDDKYVIEGEKVRRRRVHFVVGLVNSNSVEVRACFGKVGAYRSEYFLEAYAKSLEKRETEQSVLEAAQL